MCPFCRGGFVQGDRTRACAGCGARHHRECLADHGGCAVFGCQGGEGLMSDAWTIDPDDPVPIGDQIVYRVLYAIARGVYRPGDKLPTVREVAARLKVNPNTVSKAYRDLERDGVLDSRRGTGVFVEEGALEVALERRQALVLERFERAVNEALEAGLSTAEVQEVLLEALGQAARARKDEVVLRDVEELARSPLARWAGKRAGRRGKTQ
ncbi:MAG: GntR family transcriptional regulator [Planctomycetota bacterium]|nr:GntR family transcriptional regulator [Planctomycetota bacterium]